MMYSETDAYKPCVGVLGRSPANHCKQQLNAPMCEVQVSLPGCIRGGCIHRHSMAHSLSKHTRKNTGGIEPLTLVSIPMTCVMNRIEKLESFFQCFDVSCTVLWALQRFVVFLGRFKSPALINSPLSPNSFLFLVVRPGAPSSVLDPSSDARSP